ncbi:hypothetical protein [Azospirillum doebereinerae]|uniref:Antifreeze protein n=1 Tax=Azospirillum doebereinerae TaxID=92933 RepID=A0A433JF95_9PROT|nr:hypothetical protein [Azospirillum doebereinerae]RUQ75830.1 hypothetical protein EJ913_01580 [Azospirillum doebereinerae]
MSASRAEPPSHAAGRAVALALTLAALGWTLPAGAQGVGAPIRLFPPGAGSPAMAPPAVATPSLPVPSPAPAAAPSVEPPTVVPEAAAPVAANPPAVAPPSMAVVPTVPPPAVIRGEALGPPDPDGAGLLDGVQGLGGDPWRGIGRAELLPLIAALPVNAPSPAAKALARRLLLSAGSPAVQADEPPPARRFGALRIEKLARLGDPRGAADLAARLPGVLAADEAAARALTDSELLAGSIDCGKAQERGRGFDDLYWRKLELFCRVRTGDRAGAELTLALLREKAPHTDPFLPVAEALIGGAPPPARNIRDSAPLTLAALRTARVGVPPDRLALTDPAVLAAVATNSSTDPATRVAAGERAAAALFLDTRQLLDLYGVVPARGDELLRVKDIAERDRTARTRALVHQAMAAAMDGTRRVALAALAVDLVEPRLRAGPVGNAAAGLLDSVSPTADAAALAPAAARLYHALGRLDAAKRWQDLALRGARMADVAWLWPLATVATGSGPSSLGLRAWLDEALRGADAPARARIAGQLALLQAVGVTVPDEAWLAATDGAGPPAGGDGADPALWQRLGDAANGGRIGETVVTALLLLGDGGPAAVSPLVTARVAANLRAVGLGPDGRALAREAMAALAGPTGPAGAGLVPATPVATTGP